MTKTRANRVEVGAKLVPGAVRVETVGKLAHSVGTSPHRIQRLARSAGASYRPSQVPKKSGGTRTIHNPHDELKRLQRRIKSLLLDGIGFPRAMMGGIRGRSARENASCHLRQPCLANIDLENFFPSTSSRVVYQVWLERLGCAPKVAWHLTELTTYERQLPQGVSTSSALANLAVWDLCQELTQLAQGLGLNFSMYVDDITFSGGRAREAIDPAARLISKHGYRIARTKTTVLARHRGPQVVTGFCVNGRSPTVGKAKLAKIEDTISEIARRRKATTDELSSLTARIDYVGSAQPGRARYLKKLALEHVPGYS